MNKLTKPELEQEKTAIESQNNLKQALAKVEKMNKILRDEMEIAGTLSKDYPDVVLLDLANDTATTIKCKGRIFAEDERVARRSYKNAWDYYINKYVVKEDRKALYEAVAVDVVQRALEQSDEYICSYRVQFDDSGIHYFQIAFLECILNVPPKARLYWLFAM